MKKQTFMGTILSAAIVTAGGIALAQQSGTGTPGSGAGSVPNQAAPMKPGDSGSSPMTQQSPGGAGAPSSMSSQAAMPPETAVGKSVVNANGEELGEISKIVGNQVIVGVGGFLGIGSRDVALDWSKITPTGMGDDMKLQTTLTKEELEAMPEYKE